MTISSSTIRVSFNGSGTTGPFNISTLEIKSEDDVLLTKVDGSSVETTLVKTTDYTVNSDLTEVTLVSALASGETLTATLDVELTQGTNFTNTGSQNFENAESALDKLTLINKQQAEALDRTLQLSVGSSGVSAVLPTPTADNFIGWNQTATALTNKTGSELISLSYSGSVIVDQFVDGTDFTAGSSTQVTLSTDPGVENNTQVFFDGVYQEKTTYSISGTTITFGSAIPGGTSIVEVTHTETNVLNAPAAGSVGSTTLSSEAITGQTDAAVALTDCFIYTDTSDSSNLKKDTVQGINDVLQITNTHLQSSAVNSQTSVTAATGDEILIADVSDSNNLKKVTAQSVAQTLNPNDLTNATIAAGDKLLFSDVSDSNNIKEDTVQGILDLVTSDTGLASQQVFTTSGTWTKPAGITKVKVTVVGGGGGGGGSSTTGNTGGTSSFGAFCSATGGSGGGTTTSGGSGGSGSGGDINMSGEKGESNVAVMTPRGGSIYGSYGRGGPGTTTSGQGSGGGSGGMSIELIDVTGTSSETVTIGGGGAAGSGGAGQGSGAGGIVIVEEYK